MERKLIEGREKQEHAFFPCQTYLFPNFCTNTFITFYVHICVWVYICMYVGMYIRMCVYMYVCVGMYAYACMCVCLFNYGLD
jgi:hypothetical protein